MTTTDETDVAASAVRGPDLADLRRRREALSAGRPTWEPMTLDEHLDACARQWPDAPYLVFESDVHTYFEVAARSRTVAGRLAAAGVGPGVHVGLLMGNSLDLYAAMFAVSRLGGCSVPLNYLLAPPELAHIIGHANCSVVLVEADVPGRDGLELLGAAMDIATEVRAPRVLVVGDGEPGYATERFNPEGHAHDGPSKSTPDSLSHLYYTSGSTALPKAVTVHHDALLREAFGTALSRAYDRQWRVLCALPPFHIFGLMQAVLASSFVGGAAVIERSFDADRALGLIERHRIRDFISVPAMSQRLVESAADGAYDVSSLTALFTAGNAVPAASWRDLQRVLGVVELGTGYGMTEAPGILSLALPEDPLDVLTDTVGRPKQAGVAGIPELDGRQHRMVIVDRETRQPVGPGIDGEILIAGPTVTRGYLRDDAANKSGFDEQGFLLTGDVGHLREDGNLVLTGRVKEMFKSGGENVTPKEVEAALYLHPAVGQAIVVGVPDPKWGEACCAWIVPKPGVEASAEELVEHCRTRLARYKVPRRVYFITAQELPLTGLGKLKRQVLVEMALQRDPEGRANE